MTTDGQAVAQTLTGQHILITGGVQGIGRAIVESLHAAGAVVIITDIQAAAGEKLVAELGERAKFFTADVRDQHGLAAAFDWLAQEQKPLLAAINNAGVEHAPKPLLDCTEEDWDRTIDINLKGVFFCLQQQIRYMMAANQGKAGHIINLASVAGLRSAPSLGPYAASKHGVVGLTRTAAVEYARANIRVNAVCPGIIKTEMMARAFEHMPEKTQTALVNSHPLRRLGEPAEVASMVRWLCSESDSFITGQTFTIDGGMLA